MKSKIFTNKVLSVFLAITLVLGMIPVFSLNVNAVTNTAVADSKTINNWQNIFSDTNNRYSGGIYIDKSVYTAEEAKDNGNSNFFADIADRLSFGKDNFGNDNFMVSLSAIGSNTEIIGYSATPTDTMLVLDLSGSMGHSYTVGYASQSYNNPVSGYDASYIENMVDATNKAIKQLQELNRHNRVGVVLYSGNSSFGSSASNTATVLLPLGRYKITGDNFINAAVTETTRNLYVRNNNRWTRSNVTYASAISVETSANLKTELGANVTEKEKAVSGGTYIQNGLLQAYNQFSKGEDTVIGDGLIQAGTQRMPIVVLMSDGAPTTAITEYNTVGTSNTGDGGDDTDSIGFLTQLTASWVKAKLTEDYNGTEAKFYTLGVGTSNNATATGVLNPASTANNANGFWNTFLAQGSVNLTLPSTRQNGGSYSHTVRPLDNAQLVKNYVNEYWTASNVDSMTKAFAEIVEEIIIQSRYYGTLVTSGDHHLDGYISFTDEIGTYMEVKDVKGIHIGENSLVTGGMFAEFIKTGDIARQPLTAQEKADLETELTNAIIDRFNISGSEALLLKNTAINNGYIDYNEQTGEFSNYMAWYADENNNYIEPYVENVSRTTTQQAKYIVKSYFYLGDVLQNHVESSMLYILVRVREDITTGRQIVDANMPASLLPMITYTIEVEGNELTDDSIISMTNNKDEKSPACLLFEVGLKDEITPYNISEKLKNEDFRKEDGVYAFYTNRWRTSNGAEFTIPNNIPESVYNHGLVGSTEAHFIPSLQNERYYYTNNTTVLNANGTEYTGNTHPKDTGVSYIHHFKFIEIVNNQPHIKAVNNPITENAIKEAVRGENNTWVIPMGTPKRYFGEEVHGEDAHIHKSDSDNKTNTLKWVNYPRTVYEGASSGAPGYHVFAYLGNNGRITATPAQGIKITKTVQEVAQNANVNTFNFVITLSDINTSEVDYRLEKADGTVEVGKREINNHKVTVALGDGDVVYITGIPKDTTYTVTEEYNAYYIGTSQNNTGVIELYTLNNVDFVNNPRGFGSLLVEKEVVHNYDTENVPSGLSAKKFDITVNFMGEENDLANITYPNNVVKVSNTEYKFQLANDEDVVFSNIPEGITYTVTENMVNANKGDKDYGFVFDAAKSSLSGTITKDAQAEALVVNKYEPKAVLPNVTITGIKDVVGTLDTTNTFTIALQPVHIGGGNNTNIGQPITIGAIKEGEKYTFNMANSISYTAVGTYSYEIYEVEPNENKPENIAYDKSFGLFSVIVTDNDVNGELEINNVIVLQQSATLSGNIENGYTITKDFNNVYMAATETFSVKKTVNGQYGVYDNDAGILFALFEGDGEQYKGMDASAYYYSLTNDDGIATFNLNIRQEDYKTAPVTYYLREMIPMVQDRVIGMTYNTDWQYTVTIYWPEGDIAPTVTYKTYDGAVVEKDTLAINNTFDPNVYSTPDIVLSGAKFLNGGALRDGDEFTFELYITDADFLLTGHAVEKSVKATKNNNQIVFDGIKFKTAGTKYMVIKEKAENKGGIVYDTTLYHITVNVVKVEDAAGKTVLQVVETENGVLKSEAIHKVGVGFVSANEISFNNTYSVTDTATVPLNVTKVLNGRHIVDGEFQFGIYDQNGALIETKKNNHNTVEFSALAFDQTNIGTHKFTVKEIVPSSAVNGVYNGVKYDLKAHEIEVTLYDNGEGKLGKTVKLNGNIVNDVNITFTNNYSANATSLVLSGLKTLTGRDLVNGEFSFLLYETGRDFAIAENATPVKQATNTVGANKNIGQYQITVNYSDNQEGLYHYVLKENIPSERKGVNYDTREYHITVVVADNGLGNMVASVQNIVCPGIHGSFTTSNLNFGNSYNTAPAEYEIGGEKKYNLTLTDGMFEFELLDEGNVSLGKVKNDANGLFKFEKQILNTVGVHKFTVKEVNGGNTLNGIVYDDAVFTVSIPVYDNGEGKLLVDENNIVITKTKGTAETAADKIEFNNEYKAEASDVFKINGKKILDGRNIVANEFEFILYEADASYNKKGNKLATAKNNKDGLFTFEKEFKFDTAKDYYFVVTEKDLGANGITYDKAEFGVKVTVKDNGAGKFVVDDITYTKGSETVESIEFVNVYRDISETGDNFNIALWVTLMIISMLGFAVTVLVKRKNCKA